MDSSSTTRSINLPHVNHFQRTVRFIDFTGVPESNLDFVNQALLPKRERALLGPGTPAGGTVVNRPEECSSNVH